MESTGLDEFDNSVRTIVAKGKLSPSLIEATVQLAMANIASDSHLVSMLFRANKKASPANKIASVYLLDAISREARSRAKKQSKGKEKEAAVLVSASPVEGVTGAGTFHSFLAKVEQILSKIVLDAWENGLPEHREKVRKVLEIWIKAGTFSSGALLRIKSKLVDPGTLLQDSPIASTSKLAASQPSPIPISDAATIPVALLTASESAKAASIARATALAASYHQKSIASDVTANIQAMLGGSSSSASTIERIIAEAAASRSAAAPPSSASATPVFAPGDFAFLQQMSNNNQLSSQPSIPSAAPPSPPTVHFPADDHRRSDGRSFGGGSDHQQNSGRSREGDDGGRAGYGRVNNDGWQTRSNNSNINNNNNSNSSNSSNADRGRRSDHGRDDRNANSSSFTSSSHQDWNSSNHRPGGAPPSNGYPNDLNRSNGGAGPGQNDRGQGLSRSADHSSSQQQQQQHHRQNSSSYASPVGNGVARRDGSFSPLVTSDEPAQKRRLIDSLAGSAVPTPVLPTPAPQTLIGDPSFPVRHLLPQPPAFALPAAGVAGRKADFVHPSRRMETTFPSPSLPIRLPTAIPVTSSSAVQPTPSAPLAISAAQIDAASSSTGTISSINPFDVDFSSFSAIDPASWIYFNAWIAARRGKGFDTAQEMQAWIEEDRHKSERMMQQQMMVMMMQQQHQQQQQMMMMMNGGGGGWGNDAVESSFSNETEAKHTNQDQNQATLGNDSASILPTGEEGEDEMAMSDDD